jgi:hypothetical protein
MAPIAPESAKPSSRQVRPPSRLRYNPVPVYVRLPPPGLTSPVPTYTAPSGPVATAPIACVAPAGQAGWNVPPASRLTHRPPLAAAAYTVSRCRGSTATLVTRPPMLVGPSGRQPPPVLGSPAACAAATE